MTDYHVYLIFDKRKNRPYYVGKWGGSKTTGYITGSTYLRRYIRMFGKDKFWARFEKVILEKIKYLDALNEREEYWIRKYNTFKVGGNRTKGGQYDWKYRQPKKKPILQYSLQGDFIREWDFAKQPTLEGLEVSYTGISDCLRGRQETAGGYIWKEKLQDNYPLKISKEKRDRSPSNKAILQFSRDGIFIKEWETPRLCSKELDINYVTLTLVLRKKRNLCGGFTFKYKEDKWQK
jgi:hypothetical protein